MTIGIVAIAQPDDIIVSVSDRMLSFDNVSQATDNAVIKTPTISDRWGVAYAATDVSVIWPIVENVRARLAVKKIWEPDEVKDHFTAAYADILRKEFTAQRLLRYGYKSVEEFRSAARAELGDDVFSALCNDLDRFDLGAEFIVHGYGSSNRAHVFVVHNPGRIIDHDLLGYAVIGSGYHMGLASLRRRPLTDQLESTIYRLLEAKFSAETATGVGKSTTVIAFNFRGDIAVMDGKIIDRIREQWDQTVKAPDPEAALDIIAGSNAVKHLTRDA